MCKEFVFTRTIVMSSLCRKVLVALLAFSLVGSIRADERKGNARKGLPNPTVKLKTTDWKGVQKLVKQHKGKVVVVDIWMTTCSACVKEFPHFVELRKRYGDNRVACISVNLDYDGIEGKPPEFYRPRVLTFLTKHEAKFDNVLINIPCIDFLDQIELASSPAIYVYAPDGKLSKRYDNDDIETSDDEFTMKDVRGLVERLLPKKPKATKSGSSKKTPQNSDKKTES